jgi:hypothetical protein
VHMPRTTRIFRFTVVALLFIGGAASTRLFHVGAGSSVRGVDQPGAATFHIPDRPSSVLPSSRSGRSALPPPTLDPDPAPLTQQPTKATTRVSSLETLAKAARLTDQQRARAGLIVAAAEQARKMAATASTTDYTDSDARTHQIDEQERLALLGVVPPSQQPAVDAYFDTR